MFLEKIQSTIGLIEEVQDNKLKENENENIAKRNTIFFDTLDKLTPSIKSYILVRKNFDFILQPNTYDKLKSAIEYSKKTFEDGKAINPTKFKQQVDTFLTAVEQEWSEFYKTSNSELISGLNILVLVHPYPITVRNCITVLNKCEKWPLTQETIDSYKETIEKARKYLKEMRFDDEIKEFLKKVQDKKATLKDVSPSIMKWIESESISDKVSLSIKNTV